MQTITTIGLDIAKSVFQVHGVDAGGQVIVRRQLKRRLHPAFCQNCGAVFSVPDGQGEETLVVVQEIERTERNRIDPAELKGLIREGVTDQTSCSRAKSR